MKPVTYFLLWIIFIMLIATIITLVKKDNEIESLKTELYNTRVDNERNYENIQDKYGCRYAYVIIGCSYDGIHYINKDTIRNNRVQHSVLIHKINNYIE